SAPGTTIGPTSGAVLDGRLRTVALQEAPGARERVVDAVVDLLPEDVVEVVGEQVGRLGVHLPAGGAVLGGHDAPVIAAQRLVERDHDEYEHDDEGGTGRDRARLQCRKPVRTTGQQQTDRHEALED